MKFYNFIKTFILWVVFFALFSLKQQSFADFNFRHLDVTKPNKSAKYGALNYGYITSFNINSILGLGVKESDLSNATFNELASNNPGLITNPVNFNRQNAAFNIMFGYKTNSPLRFEFATSFSQGRQFLIPRQFTANILVNNGFGIINSSSSSNYTFSSVDMLVRNLNFMGNVYLDMDMSIFRVYAGTGIGPNLISGVIRGNKYINGANLQTDAVSTKMVYNNIGLVGNFIFGTQVLIAKRIALDFAFKNIFSVYSFGKDKNININGNTTTTQSPSKFSLQMFTMGILFYF